MTDEHTKDDAAEPELGVDLTTWEPPPMMEPHLADEVIARMKRVVPTTRPRNRRAWLAGGALAAAAAGGLVAFSITRVGGSEDGRREIPATVAMGNNMTARVYRDFPGATYEQKVALGDTTAMLEVNAGFRAVREGSDLYVVDARGEIQWQLGPGDRLHVALGGGASFDAEPGSALITRIHTSADRPIHVEIAPGETARVHARDGHGDKQLVGLGSTLVLEPPGSWELVGVDTPVVDPFATCDDHRRAAKKHADQGNGAAVLAELEVAYACDRRPDDLVELIGKACELHDRATAEKYYSTTGNGPNLDQALETCRKWNVDLEEARPLHTGCMPADLEAYKNQGNMNLGANQSAAALLDYQRAFTCSEMAGRPDTSLYPRLVLASCKSGDAAKAKSYYAKCGAACSTLVARCLSLHIDLKR